MNKLEPSTHDLCLLCGEFMGGFRKSTKDVTDYSRKSIVDTLGTFIMINTPQQQQLHNDSSICQNCFIKLNELDEHQVIADRIKIDLLNSYNCTHRLQFPDVKVKIETVEAIPDVDNFDDDIEENFIDMSANPDSPEIDYVQVERILSKKSFKRRFESSDDEKPRKKRGPKPKGSKNDENIIIHYINEMPHYQCKICGRTVKKKAQIKQHIQIHTNERNICCQECGMMFKTQSCLYSHRKIHMEREKMICDLCGKTFEKKYYLLEHMNAIHLDVREYTCTVCGAAFARKRSLIKHAFVHQSEAEKKVICEVCGFKSHTRQGMKRHAKTHTGEKNYACEICDKRFACRYNVTAHVNSVHKGIRKKVDESKLRCMLCGRKFPRQKQLRRHLFEEHNMLNYAAEFTGIQI